MNETQLTQSELSFEEFKNEVLADYRLLCISREASALGRKEVLTGKAKFGIFGAGKELPQIALSKVFKNGDFRSVYYRDQTFMMAIGALDLESFFAQLYAITDINIEKSSAGRQMTSHFATHSLDDKGEWNRLSEQKNSSADISPTAGQMPRLLGLAQASKVYRELPNADETQHFSVNGNEIAWGTIGDASTSEGHFWETINAAAVLQVPMVLSIWDDNYGISVPSKFQHAKNLSKLLSGFNLGEDDRGIEILNVKAWDYTALIDVYLEAETIAREKHQPVIVHVEECTQPQGHSTSGSHERYKPKERLEWEKEHDNIKKFKEWILEFAVPDNPELIIATEEELNIIELESKKTVKKVQKETFQKYKEIIEILQNEAIALSVNLANVSSKEAEISSLISELKNAMTIYKRNVFGFVNKVLRITIKEESNERKALVQWLKKNKIDQQHQYSSHLWNEDNLENLQKGVAPSYADDAPEVDGRVILRDNFDRILAENPKVLIFGEDAGQIGDVNQGLQGLQEKHGAFRVADTGIRESTILGQGIGLAMRGLRPIAEIQYLDYLLYCLQTMSDDLATLRYRTSGRQKAPTIIRTRGHRLEGIWHAGSPMGGILNFVRGMHVLVPRNMTQAAGFYNTLLEMDDPALVVESLNGYRLKEKMPNNLAELRTPIGTVEITKEGTDVTLVTYGSTWRIVMEAAEELEQMGVSTEVIDIQSLLPFDLNHDIAKSLEKTNRLVVIDEDVPGGASAYMLRHILEEQKGYYLLDSPPVTITAKAHRPAYATDGDYFSKPSLDDVIEKVYQLMTEVQPHKFPNLL